MYTIKPIGYVENKFNKPAPPEKMREEESIIIIKPEFREGLYAIENSEYIQVVFYFHLSRDYKLKGPRHHGSIRGVFASRSPNRPNSIGITTVKLLKRVDNKLRVYGLDAINETPVIDIKPYTEIMDSTYFKEE